MQKLENFKTTTKIVALIGLVIIEKKLLDISIPKNPLLLRKVILIGGTVALVTLTEKTVLRSIDRYFNEIIKDIKENDCPNLDIIQYTKRDGTKNETR